MMYVKYGDYEFEPWEAGLSVSMTANKTPRGFRKTVDWRFDIDGEFCTTGVDNVNDKITAMQFAFSQDFKDCGLVKEDGSPSVHYLVNNDVRNLTGNLVIYQKYPQTIGGEFITGRKFEIGVAAEVLDPDTALLDYKDHIKIVGNAGPQYQWYYNRFWGPYFERVAPSSFQRILHYGYAKSLYTYFLPPPPFYQPPFEDNERRGVEWYGPDRYPQGYSDYVTRWTYHYILPVANDGLRPTRR